MIGGAMLLLPSTRAIFPAKGCFSTNQDILFEMVSATRTDKISKELVAFVRDFAEYRFATGRPSRRVLPNEDRNTTTRNQDLEMAVGRKVEERSCEIFNRVAQDASKHFPAHSICSRHCLLEQSNQDPPDIHQYSTQMHAPILFMKLKHILRALFLLFSCMA
jgi:hypothetical protein